MNLAFLEVGVTPPFVKNCALSREPEATTAPELLWRGFRDSLDQIEDLSSVSPSVTGLTIMLAEPESSMRRAWAHARRKFFEALKVNPKDQSAIGILAQMDELFAIDGRAREQGLTHHDRQVLRLEKAGPMLEQIKAPIVVARIDALPKSPLAKACNYTLTLWQRLTRFLDYPVLELSNNLAENAIRPVALGRRN